MASMTIPEARALIAAGDGAVKPLLIKAARLMVEEADAMEDSAVRKEQQLEHQGEEAEGLRREIADLKAALAKRKAAAETFKNDLADIEGRINDVVNNEGSDNLEQLEETKVLVEAAIAYLRDGSWTPSTGTG